MGVVASDSSEEAEEAEDDQQNGGEQVKNFRDSGAKLFMDGIGYSRLEIQQMCEKLFGTFVSDAIDLV